jgi:nitroimidazol reductase NimA-like FMN-containing flavoprotein (pyridoxamine 5'-phosphate oxidase superfamily)
MLITKMRNRECRELLTRLGFGRLACVSNNRPYIVPIYFSYDADCCDERALSVIRISW